MCRRILVSLAACAFVHFAVAKDYVIPENTTFTFPAGQTKDTGNPTNGWANVIVLNSGCTMNVTSPASSSVVYAQIVVVGDATLDFSEWTRTAGPVLYGLMVKDGATLTLKGRDGVVVNLGRGSGADLSDLTAQNPVYDLDGIRFDGVDGIQFVNPAIIRTLPSDPDVLALISFDDGKSIGLAGTNTVAALTDDAGNFNYNGDVFVMSETAVPAGKGVNVFPKRTLTVSPVKFSMYGSYCDRTLSSAFGHKWSPVKVSAMGAGSSVTALRRTQVEIGEGVAYWGCSTPMVSEFHQADAGSAVSLAACAAVPGAKVFATAGTDYTFADAGAVPIVAAGGQKIDLVSAANPTVYANGGVTTLGAPTWNGDVPFLWLDSSKAETFMHTGARTELEIADTAKKFAQPVFIENADNAMLVEQWCDCRDTDHPYGRDVALMNPRIYGSWAYLVIPYLRPTGGPTGGRYLTCGRPSGSDALGGNMVNANGDQISTRGTKDVCRFLFYNNAGTRGTVPGSKSRTDIKTVVMVFGAQQGGGFAPLADNKFLYHRGGATLEDPVTTNESHTLWLNGVEVVPNETKFSDDGWHILSIDTTGRTLTGIGFGGGSNGQNDVGGQNYAEILFFTNALSSAQREDVERYLARKWNLESKYAVTPRAVKLMGAGGTVAVKDDVVSLSGSFSGTLALDGAAVTIADEVRPPTKAEIPTEDRIGWFDPDNATGMSRSGENITALWNECAARSANKHLVGSGGRSPHPLQSARGFGVERRWVDYNDEYCEVQSSQNGNTLRVQTHDGTAFGKDDTPFENVRTVVMVQDSVRGGGAPFLTAVQGAPNRATDDFTENKWATTTSYPVSEACSNAVTRLNGVVSPAAEGFTGAPEVYSVVASADMTVGAFANFYNSQGVKYDGEIQGEILMYSRALEGAELETVEAYLMNKWLNVLPVGYSDLSGATLTGSGTVSAAKWSQLPKIGEGFTGTVSAASAEGLAFSIGADGTVAGAILAPDVTLELPATCAATVTLPDARLAYGEYTLVDCKGWGATEWTVTVVDPRSGRRTVTTAAGDGKIVLKIESSGMLLMLR